MSYRKTALIEQVRRDLGLNEADAKATVDAVLAGVTRLTAGGEMLMLNGFGTFVQRHRRESFTRNPRTGEPMKVPATVRLGFKGSKG